MNEVEELDPQENTAQPRAKGTTPTIASALCDYINHDCESCPVFVFYGMHKAYEGNKKCHMVESIRLLEANGFGPRPEKLPDDVIEMKIKDLLEPHNYESYLQKKATRIGGGFFEGVFRRRKPEYRLPANGRKAKRNGS